MPPKPWLILILIVLSIFAYLPALNLPFISDDWAQIQMARDFASHGWTELWQNKDLRARTTYMFLSAALDGAFGFTPRPFYAASILLHVLCVLLVYAAILASGFDTAWAFFAAAFFAVAEGHQEAVMWVAASSDLFVFLFGLAAWICWVQWLKLGGWLWYGSAVFAFVLALASKESAWVFPLLMLLPIGLQPTRLKRALVGVAPFFVLAGGYVLWTWITRVAQPGYHDNRFGLSALWPVVILNSVWRLYFVWGLIAGGILLWLRGPNVQRTLVIATLWMILGILPNSFLTYMNRVPSRHTYVASVGLAFLVGAAAFRLLEERCRTMLAVFCAAALVVNVDILWVKKMDQFRRRAEPSEKLTQVAMRASGPVTVECIGITTTTSEYVLRAAGHQVIFPPNSRYDDHCFSVTYKTVDGQTVKVDERLP